MRLCDICEYPLKGDGKTVLPNEGRAQLMADGRTKFHADPHDCIALMRADLHATDAMMFDQAKEIGELRRRLAKLERGKR